VRLAVAALAVGLLVTATEADASGGFRSEPTSFARIEGWAGDDHAAAFMAFRRSCGAVARQGTIRRAQSRVRSLAPICRRALHLSNVSRDDARTFFERWFEPARIVPEGGTGFLTGYFEPEYRGSLTRTAAFSAPLLARPSGVRTFPDRAAIENGALGSLARPIVYLDPIEAFIVHVQGSARIRLPDGNVMRVAFAGRNGHPYTAIARVLAQRENIPPSELNLAGLVAWLRAHPAEAPGVMQLNKSYIFFRRALDLSPEDGPVGGAGIPLTAGRSLAIDRRIWSYGLPFWLDGELPLPEGGMEPLHRLTIAQDTGTAIIGPARGDLFFGSGDAAGAQAGLVRHPVGFTILRPRTQQELRAGEP
jgi:membrane-bound lytic murein transglycosylase A